MLQWARARVGAGALSTGREGAGSAGGAHLRCRAEAEVWPATARARRAPLLARGRCDLCAVAFTRGPGRVWRLSQQVSTLLARRTASAAEEAREPKREMRGLSLME